MAWIYQKLFSLDCGNDYITVMCLGLVDWMTCAFEVGGNQCPANHVDVVFQDSKKQCRVYHDLVKD